VAGSCEHGNKPSGSIKCGEFHERTLRFSRRTLLDGDRKKKERKIHQNVDYSFKVL
jgi:hypothetical protein